MRASAVGSLPWPLSLHHSSARDGTLLQGPALPQGLPLPPWAGQRCQAASTPESCLGAMMGRPARLILGALSQWAPQLPREEEQPRGQPQGLTPHTTQDDPKVNVAGGCSTLLRPSLHCTQGLGRKPQSPQDPGAIELFPDSLQGCREAVGDGLLYQRPARCLPGLRSSAVMPCPASLCGPLQGHQGATAEPPCLRTNKWITYEHKSEHSKFHSSLIFEHLFMPDVAANTSGVCCII